MDKASLPRMLRLEIMLYWDVGEEAPNVLKPAVYAFGIATVGDAA